jgi:hypothetical protein
MLLTNPLDSRRRERLRQTTCTGYWVVGTLFQTEAELSRHPARLRLRLQLTNQVHQCGWNGKQRLSNNTPKFKITRGGSALNELETFD